MVQLHVRQQFKDEDSPFFDKTTSKSNRRQVPSDEYRKRDPFIGSLMIGVAYIVVEHVFRHISGGPFNPAIALAQVMW
jgi:glycerol uptake facilitator-like aquaporin